MRTEEDKKVYKRTDKISCCFQKALRFFCSFHTRLALRFSIVSIGAVLVVEVGVMVLSLIIINRCIDLSPKNQILNLSKIWAPKMQQFFSLEPPEVEGATAYIEDVQDTVFSTCPLFTIGNYKLEMKMQDTLQFYYLLNDRTLVHTIPSGIVPEQDLGKIIPFDYLPGLSSPLRAALEGLEDKNVIYENVEPCNYIVGAFSVYRLEPIEAETLNGTRDNILNVEDNLVGVIVFTTQPFELEEFPSTKMMVYIGVSFLLVAQFIVLLGTCFGFYATKDLNSRLKRVSKAVHDWSCGDFSVSIMDSTDDEIGKLTDNINNIAEQIKNLMDCRQILTELEERNRLTRDLLQNIEQWTITASEKIEAAKECILHRPDQAFTHLIEAEILIDKLRQELPELFPEIQHKN